jgi:hypothetical protein
MVLILLLGLIAFCFWHRILVQMLAARTLADPPSAVLERGDSQESREVRRHVALWRSFLKPTPEEGYAAESRSHTHHGHAEDTGMAAPPVSRNPSITQSWVPYSGAQTPKRRQPLVERLSSSETHGQRRPDVTMFPASILSHWMIPMTTPMPPVITRDAFSSRRMGIILPDISADEGYDSSSSIRGSGSSWRVIRQASQAFQRVSTLFANVSPPSISRLIQRRASFQRRTTW